MRRFEGRSVGAGTLVAALLAAGLSLVAVPASADTAPPDPGIPATVSADVLPTVQINGVVWSQATIGNTVYAVGDFTRARPAGSAAGVNETPRNNILAFNITTGNLITTFNPYLNAPGMVIKASPDGSRLFVGGDFTTAGGEAHQRIVAINPANGAVISSFAPQMNARVSSLAVSGSTVYAGGSFTAANGVTRTRLAAFDSTSGALLNWGPVANRQVEAMALSPSGTKVIVGGRFQSLNGVTAGSLGALNATSGATLPFGMDQVKTTAKTTDRAGITSLRTDGTTLYGTGFDFYGQQFEGTFAADPETGAVKWIEDCHGDTYDTFATPTVVYTVAHAHYCGNIGSFPETVPRSWRRSLAFGNAPTGTIAHNGAGNYRDFFGNPSPSLLDWFPTLVKGSYTGQGQAAWSAAGTSQYVSLGGEFPTVNSIGQQGLVRFAIPSIAPKKMGPRPNAALTPTLTPGTGTVKVNWGTTFDQDNEGLTYRVVRDGNTAAPVHSAMIKSRPWSLPAATFTDTGLTAGTHTYRIFVYDPDGNSNSGSTVTTTVTAGAPVTQLAVDGFNRTVSGGWGSADTGGAWTTSGAAGNLAVSPGEATITLPTASTSAGASLRSVSATGSDTTLSLSSDKVANGSGVFTYVTGRRVSTNNEYRARAAIRSNGAVGVSLSRLAGSSTETVIAAETSVPGLAYAPGQQLRFRVRVSGTNPTTIQAKVWADGTAEPSAWLVSATDATAALQAAGGLGVSGYLTGSATNAPVTLTVRDLASVPA